MFGSLEEFDPTTDDISTCLEKLQLYFAANKVEDDRKVPILLTVIGAKAYSTLRSLLAPDSPADKSFNDLLITLKGHFDPKSLIIGEQFRFYQRSQKLDENIVDLRRLSINCEFRAFLDQALQDRFVCGVRSRAIQKRLLAEADLTIKTAQEIAQGMESADNNNNNNYYYYFFTVQG